MASSIDTNILLRLILGDVPKQEELAVELIDSGEDFAVSDLAITEMVFVLEKQQEWKRRLIIESLSTLFEIKNLLIDRELFREVFKIYLRRPKLSFNDCYLAVWAGREGCAPLYTFDRKLAEQIEGVVEVK